VRRGKDRKEVKPHGGSILITCVSSDRDECRYEIEKQKLAYFHPSGSLFSGIWFWGLIHCKTPIAV